jgi:hypothetical protein
MKNYGIFAVYFAKVYFITIASVVFFIATNTALYAESIGYQIPAVCCASIVSKCTLASSGGDSLSYLLNFSFAMPKYNENASKANNSSRTRTPAGRNTVSIEAFNIEKNAKNKAYSFILSYGLSDRFVKFSKNFHSGDPHRDCLEYLISKTLNP